MVILFILSNSGTMDNIEIDGDFVKIGNMRCSLDFDKKSETFIERSPGITETGTYRVNNSLLILYYSNGKISEYYISDKGFSLTSVNGSLLFLKPEIM